MPLGQKTKMNILDLEGSNVMNILARCVLEMYTFDENPDDTSRDNLMRQSIDLISKFPTIIAYAYNIMRHSHGKTLHIRHPKEEYSIAENFLYMLKGEFSELEAKTLDRALLLKEMARDLAKEKEREEEYAFLELLEERAIENFMNFKGTKVNKRVCANVDFYSGFVYDMIGLPQEVFTPLFAMSRITGWTAHRIEELNFDSKRIIRPAYKNVAAERKFVPLKQR